MQPSRCVGGHVSVGQNGSDGHRCGACVGHDCVGGQSTGDVGYIVHPNICVGGHATVCGQPNIYVGLQLCVAGPHATVCTGQPCVVGRSHGTDGHGWHDTFGCDGGQWPGGHVRLWTVGHGWHEYAGCDTGHSGHVMCTDGQFGGTETGLLPPPSLLQTSGGQVTMLTVGHGT